VCFVRARNWILNFYLHFMLQCLTSESFVVCGVGAFQSGFVCDMVGELEPPPANKLV
jgi:hypothetical protein